MALKNFTKADFDQLAENIRKSSKDILKFLIEDQKDIGESLLSIEQTKLKVEDALNKSNSEVKKGGEPISFEDAMLIMNQYDEMEREMDNWPGAKQQKPLKKSDSVASLSGSNTNLTRLQDRGAMMSNSNISVLNSVRSNDRTMLMPPPPPPPAPVEPEPEIIKLTEEEIIEFNNLKEMFIYKLQSPQSTGLNPEAKKKMIQSVHNLVGFLQSALSELTSFHSEASNNNNQKTGFDTNTLTNLAALNKVRHSIRIFF